MALTIEIPHTRRHPSEPSLAWLYPPTRVIYLIRRAAVLLIAAAIVIGGALTAFSYSGDSAPTRPISSGEVISVGAGDTYWSIAGGYMTGVDRREAVADLIALNGGNSSLRVGDVIAIPSQR